MTDNGFVGCLKNILLRQVFVIPYIPFSVGPLYFERNIKNYTCRSSASQKETQVPNFDHITNVNPCSNILLSLRQSKFFRKETGKRKRGVSFHIKFETFHVEFTRKCFFFPFHIANKMF